MIASVGLTVSELALMLCSLVENRPECCDQEIVNLVLVGYSVKIMTNGEPDTDGLPTYHEYHVEAVEHEQDA